jgi:hypothetical protein
MGSNGGELTGQNPYFTVFDCFSDACFGEVCHGSEAMLKQNKITALASSYNGAMVFRIPRWLTQETYGIQ